MIMRKFFTWAAVLLLAGCSARSYLEESKNIVELPFSVAYDISSEGILLSWEANWDNTSFRVSRGSSEKDLEVYIPSLFQTSWLDVETISGQEYVYRIDAFTESGRHVGRTPVMAGYRSYQDFNTMHAPTEFSADQSQFGDRITLRWFGQEESRFRVYRSSELAGSYEKIAEVYGVSFVDTNVEPGQKWFYKIASVGRDRSVPANGRNPAAGGEKERYYSSVAGGTEGILSPAEAPALVGSTSDSPGGLSSSGLSSTYARSGTIRLTWPWDSAADYYRIYRSDSQDGSYSLVTPYSRSVTNIDGKVYGVYNDKGMPSLEGAYEGNQFEYPVYYYKVGAVKNNQETPLSALASGQAINPVDILPAPENVRASLVKAEISGFVPGRKFPVLENGRYTLDITWAALPSSISDRHGFYILSSNTVSGAVKNETPLPLASTATSYRVLNPAFNEEIRYIVYAANLSKGGLEGDRGSYLYKSITPPAPSMVAASKLKRVEVTNEVGTNAITYTRYKTFLGNRYNYQTGFVSKVWTTKALVGDVDVSFRAGGSVGMQRSYNVYRAHRRYAVSGGSKIYYDPVDWKLITNVQQTISIDDPEAVVDQLLVDKNFTSTEYGAGGSGNIPQNFYPEFEYRVTAVNNGEESSLSANHALGQPINPADVLPAPEYLSVPFHYAYGTGLAFWESWWQVSGNGGPQYTTGFDQIDGQWGRSGETQRIFVTWAPIKAPAGASFDYRFRHVRSDFAGLDGSQYAQPDYLQPESWYVHGGVGRNTVMRLNNETTTANMTYLYNVADSGIGGAFDPNLPSYVPGSAFFAVSATNRSGGLEGNTIGIRFEESHDNPY